MSERAHLSSYDLFHSFRNVSVRIGIYVGVCLSVVLSGWVIVANRVPFLDRFALARNLAAVALLGLIALIPILRFWRSPGNLLTSSLLGWLILSLTYRAVCMDFHGLSGRFSAVQMFVLGAVIYLLVVTLSWIGTIIRRARAADETHPNHHLSRS